MAADHDAPTHPRLGFLYPGHAAEDDYPLLAELVASDPVITVVHTSVGEDAHRIDALLDLGGDERLAAGSDQLAGDVDAVVWACTSGSFVFGLDGARAQAAAIGQRAGVPASSTSLGFVAAMEALGCVNPTIAATYPDEVVAAFVDFLAQAGIEVVSASGQGIVTAAEVGTLDRDRVLSFVAAADHPDAEVILVPDTALHTARWLDDIEEELGKPVLTANQVSFWEALRLVAADRPQPGLGTLFAG